MGCLRKSELSLYIYVESLIIVPAINLVMGFYVWLLNMAAAAAFLWKLLLDISYRQTCRRWAVTKQ